MKLYTDLQRLAYTNGLLEGSELAFSAFKEGLKDRGFAVPADIMFGIFADMLEKIEDKMKEASMH